MVTPHVTKMSGTFLDSRRAGRVAIYPMDGVNKVGHKKSKRSSDSRQTLKQSLTIRSLPGFYIKESPSNRTGFVYQTNFKKHKLTLNSHYLNPLLKPELGHDPLF